MLYIYIYIWCCGYKVIYTFLNGISTKVNIIVQLKFKLSYFKIAVQHFIYRATETPLWLSVHLYRKIFNRKFKWHI